MKLVNENIKLQQFKTNIFYLGLLTLTAIVIWVGVTVYTSFSKTSIDNSMQSLIEPLNPTLDTQSLLDFGSSRIVPPAQFQIVAIIKSANGNDTTTTLIDPFSASPSAQ